MLNLLGSGCAQRILEVLPARKVVVSRVSREILRHPLQPRATTDPLAPLIDAAVLEMLPLREPALERFMTFVGAPAPDALGDGEAATLAVAELLGLTAVIDDGKARRIASFASPSGQLLSSVDLFRHEAVSAALGAEDHANAVYSALVNARMRVLPGDESWARGLIGSARAELCPSLRKRRRTAGTSTRP